MRKSLAIAYGWAVRNQVGCVCVLLALLQAYVVSYPDPILMTWPDSIGYLGPAADALGRGYFSHWYGRGFVYPLFLLGLLSISPEPWAIILGQRLLVMATYCCLAGSMWLLARHALRRRLAKRWTVTVFVVFWLLVYMFYPPVIGLAHALMAETLFSCILMLVVFCIVLVCLPEVSSRWRLTAASLVVFLAVTLVFVKPHWLLAACMVTLILPFVAPTKHRKTVFRGIGLGGVLALALLVFPEKMLQGKYDSYSSQIFGPRSLYCNSSDVILNFLQKEGDDQFSEQVVRSLTKILDPESRIKSIGWTALGFNGDSCMYGETAKLVSSHFAGQVSAEKNYYYVTYLRAIFIKPFYIFDRLVIQIGVLATGFFSELPVGYVADLHTIKTDESLRTFFKPWLEGHKWKLVGIIDLPFGDYDTERKIFFEVAEVFLLMMLLFALGRLLLWRSKIKIWSSLEKCFMIIFVSVAAMNILIAVVHTFDIWRYAAMQAPLFCILGYLATILTLQPIRRSVAMPAI